MKVTIGAGKWKVVSNNADAELRVFIDDFPLPSSDGSEFVTQGIAKIYAVIGESGSKLLDVHVESM